MDEVLKKSLEWCENHAGWKRICDIENSDSLYKTWDELSDKDKKPWIREYRSDAEGAWGEWGHKPCKVPFGFVTVNGEFYKKITDIPQFHDFMQVYKVC